jgi:5-methylcytosine-specific restriction endonuclease McrA
VGRGRTPPYPAHPEWTTSRFWSFIRGALRAKFRSWPEKYKAKAAASEACRTGTYKTGRHAGEPKYTTYYKCAVCEEHFRDKDIEVDHMIQAGSLKCKEDLAGFVDRMFCSAEHLQVVCKPCHKIKTAEERKKV